MPEEKKTIEEAVIDTVIFALSGGKSTDRVEVGGGLSKRVILRSELTRTTSFVNDLRVDSLDSVELIMEFEDKFRLQIPDEEAEKMQTIGHVVTYVSERYTGQEYNK